MIKGVSGETQPNPSLIQLVVKAHAFWAALLRDNLTMTELAAREGVTSSYVTRLVRLASLAPDITATILNGQQPTSMTANTLLMHSRLPLTWAEQRRVLGCH